MQGEHAAALDHLHGRISEAQKEKEAAQGLLEEFKGSKARLSRQLEQVQAESKDLSRGAFLRMFFHVSGLLGQMKRNKQIALVLP